MVLIYPDRLIKLSKSDYLFYFCIIIFLGSGTIFTRGSLENFGGFTAVTLVGKMFMMTYALHLLHKHGINLCASIKWNIVLILLIWAILQINKYQILSVYVFMRLMNLFFATAIIKVYGRLSIYLFEDVITKLAIISLIGWILVLLMPNVMLALADMSPIEQYGLVQNGSFLVFGISDSFEILRRNLGFAWEPGRFGSILSVGLFFNLIANKFKIRRNKNFWYILSAILSTQSTTAYTTLMLIILFYLYNKRKDVFIRLIPLVSILFYMIIKFDFVGEKIQLLWLTDEHAYEWQKQLDFYSSQDGTIVPQRFDGLAYEFLNILHDPLIGNASDVEAYLYSIFGVRFSLSNGCLRIFANMGIFIGFLYYVCLYRSSKFLSEAFRYKGTWFWFVLFVMINISYSWVFEPAFLAIIFLPLYYKLNNSFDCDFSRNERRNGVG